MEYYAIHLSGESLFHHGIAGQKWGVRNGPPYPLSYGDHSKRELREMRKKSRQASRKKNVKKAEAEREANKQLIESETKRILKEYKENPQYKKAFDKYLVAFYASPELTGSYNSAMANAVVNIALQRPKLSDIPKMLEKVWDEQSDKIGWDGTTLKDDFTKKEFMEIGESDVNTYLRTMDYVDSMSRKSPTIDEVLSSEISNQLYRRDFVKFSGLYETDK